MGGELYPKKPLKKVATLIMGQSPPGSTYNESGNGIPFYQGVRDFGKRYPTHRVYCTAPTRFAEKGDILFSVRAPIGEVNRAIEQCAIGRVLAAIRANDELDTTYLEYVLRNIRSEWDILEGQGAVFGNAKKSDLENLLIPWPHEKKRKAFAHIFGSLDDKIELNRRMNETLEAMAQTIFKSWFVDFDPVVYKAVQAGNPVPQRFAGTSARYQNGAPCPVPEHIAAPFPDRFVGSELGPIPEGWEATTIGSEFDLTMGQSPPGSTYNEEGEGLPFFQGRRDFGFRYPSNRVYCTAPKRIAHDGDTLVSVRAPVGDINMACETCCVGRGVAAVRHKSGSRSYTYYAMLALSERFKSYESEGTVFGAINKKQFQNLPSIAPQPDIVSSFEKLAYPLDENIRSFEEEIRTLSEIRDTLLPKLISGELRLPAAALEFAAQAGVPDVQKFAEEVI